MLAMTRLKGRWSGSSSAGVGCGGKAGELSREYGRRGMQGGRRGSSVEGVGQEGHAGVAAAAVDGDMKRWRLCP